MKASTWPENCWPTAEQWLDWLLANDREDQLAIAARVIDASRDVRRCFEANHEGAVEELQRARADFAEAYQRGWNEALTTFVTKWGEIA